MQLESVVAPHPTIGEAAPSTLGNVLFLVLGHSEAVSACLEKYEDAKDKVQERALLVERERDELTKYILY